MIRVLFFLIVVGALSLGVAYLADRPGDVVVTWQGWRIETSLMVLAVAAVAAMAALALLLSFLRAILRSPLIIRAHLRERRGARAYKAISRGLVAVGAGDLGAARKLTTEVNRLAPAEPLALLLSAQSAQLAGDRAAADRAFRAMASRADTKALGLHGLFIEARRRDDLASARAYAEEAARTSPALDWAGKAVLELRSAAGDWAGALALLERRRGALDKASYRRQRAVLLTAQALAAEEGNRDEAKMFALEAAKLAPTLVPAAALAGRMLAEGGELRHAARILNRAWQANPHPDLAQVVCDLRFGDAARDRLRRIEALVKKTPGHIEGALALARAAIEAQEFATARAALAPCLAVPTKRVALLMAALERAERNDEGRAREWIARAVNAAPDPVWTADGYVSDRWLPVSPVSGRVDAFEWRVPLSGLPSAAPMIETEPPAAAPAVAAPASPPPLADASSTGEQSASTDPATLTAPTPAAPVGPATPAAPAAAPLAPAPRRRLRPDPEPVIPLLHAPDDPGPEAVEGG